MTARLRDHGQRYLILGVGVLDGLTQRQLRAVLAHEYGHFSHRDTAGGDLAGTVRASLLAAIIRLAGAGGASVLNPAWHFLRLFFALFLRITLGASRLQEVLADRFAATAYGGPALAEGLQHVVRRSVEFEAKADVIIRRAQEQRRAIASLYVLPSDGAAVPAQDDVQAAVAKAMSEAGSPYDSHPPVGRRLAWLAAFGAASQPVDAVAAAADPAAWDLFPDRASTEARMTAIVNGRLDAAGHIDVPVPASVASPLGPRL
jgi:Zn-dependent protease with chaperone function